MKTEAEPVAHRDFLFEIGAEELPPKALRKLSQALESEFLARLQAAGLEHGEVASFATPRRLALLVRELAEQQPDRKVERFGPAWAAAFDSAGEPTAAARGFARSCGVPVERLGSKLRQGAKKLHVSLVEPGASSTSLLPQIAEESLAALPIPKRMRWGSSRAEFVRPVHWIVMMFGEKVVNAEILGEKTGKSSFGHRFHHPQLIELGHPRDYEQALQRPGHVIASFQRRRDTIAELVAEQAQRLGAKANIDGELLDEVTSLVEYPVALTGRIDREFLDLPREVLILTLKHHQKCFCLEDEADELIPHFVTISNITSREPGGVVKGNERVIRPRLADARFFFESDKSRGLASCLAELDAVVFQEKLGSVGAKSRRVARLASLVAEQLAVDPEPCARAASLGKCDLVSDMVGEFAELQGLMGACYARHDGEPEAVATAIFEQYLPRHTGDQLPATPPGQVVALAEKLDTLAGLFAIGEPPTGSRDPFALRRAALGILRILIESELELDLAQVIDQALAGYPELEIEPGCQQRIFDFVLDRLRAWYADAGLAAQIYLCVRELRPASPLDFHRRVQAVADFAAQPEAAALAAANKRVSNLLAKSPGESEAGEIDMKLLSENAERQLVTRLREKQAEVLPLFAARDYRQGLLRLADMRDEVDRFFDEVMVMVEEPAVRANRLCILRRVRELFLHVADVSLL